MKNIIDKNTAAGAKIVSCFGVTAVCTIIACMIQKSILNDIGEVFGRIINFIDENS